MKFITYFVLPLAAVFILALMLEAFSLAPKYELRPATVLKVTDDQRGFIGYDRMTIVKFEDDYVTEVAGDKGEPGDKVLVYRQNGVSSIFGILGQPE